jgi:putative PIN family toxin of toxin-antitoxin system
MRVVVDTNVLVSAVLSSTSPAARLLEEWRHGDFDVVSAPAQIEELTRVLRYPKIRQRVPLATGSNLVADLKERCIMVSDLPIVERSPDPADNYLLAIAEAAGAQYLVSGDKRDILSLLTHKETRIVSLREFLTILGN